MRNTFLFFFLLGITFSGFGQSITQAIRGSIIDEANGQPIKDVVVILDSQNKSVQSDEKGKFKLTEIPAGRHSLTFQKDGYTPYVLPDLVLNSGKELVLAITLEERVFETETVEIQATIDRDLNRVSTRLFTVEESKRFAAVYFDPARMAASFPGVVQDNDQGNQLIVRGNSPNGLRWRIEGVDIVNPNHLTNAGTFSDRLTQSGGGTIILSTQLLANSSFSSGAFSPEFGNALSGVFDINFRKGNDERVEFTGQAGLIGIDLSAEGPLNRKSGASFLVNYRYSTIGLLTLLNVPVGDEAITYQDLALNLHLPTKKAGTFSVFAMGGLSSNRFEGPREDSLIQEQKDRFDIFFNSNMGAVGATHELLVGKRTLWRSVAALSALQSSRTTAFLNEDFEAQPVEDDQLLQRRLSISSTVSHKFNAQLSLKGGFYLSQIGYELSSFFQPPSGGRPQTLASGMGNYWLLQPFADFHWQPLPQLDIRTGLHSMYFFLNGSSALEPRFSTNWRINTRNQVRFAYGLHSQLQLPGTYFAAFPGPVDQILTPNQNLDFTRAHHLVLSYQYQLNSFWLFRLEPYYQSLFDVPVGTDPNRPFSAINLMEGYVDQELVNAGTGTNYGLDFSLEKLLNRNYYLLLSGSLYESTYALPGGPNLSTRFNGRYAFTASGGWEKEGLSLKGFQRVLGLNMRMIYRGGLRGQPIDLEASRVAMRTIFDETAGFSDQFPDYFRIDFRLTLKRNRAKYTRTLGIDIQNMLNTYNVAYRYYDFQLDQIVDRNQLGIIPLLSYRLEF